MVDPAGLPVAGQPAPPDRDRLDRQLGHAAGRDVEARHPAVLRGGARDRGGGRPGRRRTAPARARCRPAPGTRRRRVGTATRPRQARDVAGGRPPGRAAAGRPRAASRPHHTPAAAGGAGQVLCRPPRIRLHPPSLSAGAGAGTRSGPVSVGGHDARPSTDAELADPRRAHRGVAGPPAREQPGGGGRRAGRGVGRAALVRPGAGRGRRTSSRSGSTCASGPCTTRRT